MSIPFIKTIDFEYEVVTRMSDRVNRVIANNPGPFTFIGTGVYIVGDEDVAVIDPGPNDKSHFEALKRALGGKKITHVLVTHNHSDHSPLAHPLAEWAGCKTYGKKPVSTPKPTIQLEADDDLDFVPDEYINDGWNCSGLNWELRAIETPGHTSNHLCFYLPQEKALFSGDHIMGWSTTVISPPDGNMADYFCSLDKVLELDPSIIYPTHGSPISDNPRGFVQAYIDHRLNRERDILGRLKLGERSIPEMVKTIYAQVDKQLHPAACHSVLAHMIHLVDQGQVSCEDANPTVASVYSLA